MRPTSEKDSVVGGGRYDLGSAAGGGGRRPAQGAESEMFSTAVLSVLTILSFFPMQLEAGTWQTDNCIIGVLTRRSVPV